MCGGASRTDFPAKAGGANPAVMSIPNAPQSMEFGLGENADMIRETTARWATDRLAPLAAEIDETNAFKREL